MPIQTLVELLEKSRYVLVFTGAGISTGSGIPDFRGPDGLWKRWQPVYYDEFMTSSSARTKHWEFKLEGWQQFRDALPNVAHRALAELDQRGQLQSLVTQNIDGLHQLAGHPAGRVVELHGTNRLVECQSCRQTFAPDPIFDDFERSRQPPICSCGGYLKPATVSFGQPMPEEKMRLALESAAQADLVCSIGSTLEVEPAASVPRVAKSGGAFYVVMNQGATAHDSLADLRIEGDVTAILPEVLSFRGSDPL